MGLVKNPRAASEAALTSTPVSPAGAPTAAPATLAPITPDPLVRLIDLQTIPMPNGILGVAEVSKHIGFPVHRAYYIRDVPTGEGRGSHGHKALRQCFLCLRGSVTITIEKLGRVPMRPIAVMPIFANWRSRTPPYSAVAGL